MTTIHETARTILAVLRGIAELGGGQHLTSLSTPAVRELLAHLDRTIPGLMNTWTYGEERCNGISIRSPDFRAQVAFQMVAPACYEPSVPFRMEAEVDAYREVARLAESEAVEPAPPHQRQAIEALPFVSADAACALDVRAVMLINDAAEAFASTLGPVPPQYSIGGVHDGKVHVTIAVDIDVASLNAFAGVLGGAS